jgi:two-component system KDP operon response regulator KdpE
MPARDHAPTNDTARILVVEDEPALRKVMVNVLREAGYAADGATNGQEALERLRSAAAPPDLVLLDLGMPVMDGWWCLRAIQTDPALARVSVAVVSAAGEEAVPPSVQGHLRKPFPVAELLGLVRSSLARAGRRAGA